MMKYFNFFNYLYIILSFYHDLNLNRIVKSSSNNFSNSVISSGIYKLYPSFNIFQFYSKAFIKYKKLTSQKNVIICIRAKIVLLLTFKNMLTLFMLMQAKT